MTRNAMYSFKFPIEKNNAKDENMLENMINSR